MTKLYELPSLFSSYADARIVADHNNAADPEWLYKPEKTPQGYGVAVYDEDGKRIGSL